MELREIQEIAMNAYAGEGKWDPANLMEESGKPLPWEMLSHYGDTLACFVVMELSDLYDPDADDLDQITNAINAIDKAVEELHAVSQALDSRYYDIDAARYFTNNV